LPLERRRAIAPYARQKLFQISSTSRHAHCKTVKRDRWGARKLINLYKPRTSPTIKGRSVCRCQRVINAGADPIVVATPSRFACRCHCVSKTPEPSDLSLPLLRESFNFPSNMAPCRTYNQRPQNNGVTSQVFDPLFPFQKLLT